jgi:hypothetical protein
MDKHTLLGKLPPFTNTSRLIESRQSVKDIIREVLEAHSIFAADYDLIASDFACQSPIQTARALFNFCKQNIRYKIEPEARQTTKSPWGHPSPWRYDRGRLQALCRLYWWGPGCLEPGRLQNFMELPFRLLRYVRSHTSARFHCCKGPGAGNLG